MASPAGPRCRSTRRVAALRVRAGSPRRRGLRPTGCLAVPSLVPQAQALLSLALPSLAVPSPAPLSLALLSPALLSPALLNLAPNPGGRGSSRPGWPMLLRRSDRRSPGRFERALASGTGPPNGRRPVRPAMAHGVRLLTCRGGGRFDRRVGGDLARRRRVGRCRGCCCGRCRALTQLAGNTSHVRRDRARGGQRSDEARHRRRGCHGIGRPDESGVQRGHGRRLGRGQRRHESLDGRVARRRIRRRWCLGHSAVVARHAVVTGWGRGCRRGGSSAGQGTGCRRALAGHPGRVRRTRVGPRRPPEHGDESAEARARERELRRPAKSFANATSRSVTAI